MQDCFEIVFSVIDDNICTEVLHPIDIGSARCRSYNRTKMLRQLNCKRSYTTRPSVDENFLPSLQVRFFDQRLPSGQADQRDGSRFFHAEFFWLIRHGILFYGDEFRESTDSILIRPRIDLVARLESPHSRSDSNYDSSQIIAQNER